MATNIGKKRSREHLERLKQYAVTEIQKEYIDAVIANGCHIRKAARSLGINHSVISLAICRLERRAALQGFTDPDGLGNAHVIPDSHYLKGKSVLIDGEGNTRLEWVKTNINQERAHELILEAIHDLAEPIRGKKKPVNPPSKSKEDMLAVMPMGDPHFGLYAWDEEAGENYDSDIAERDNIVATDELNEAIPNCRHALIINVGDYYHSDNHENRTRRSGNALDVDTRLLKVFRTGVRVMCYKIDAALKKHETVTVRNAIGNHDEVLSMMLSEVLNAYYSQEPRVNIVTDPTAFWYFRFGKNLIGVTHGDKTKPGDLGEIMSSDRPEDWGETEYRWWITGHIHHMNVHELRGCTVETFRTLAARDAWSTAEGYRSRRDIHCAILHKDFGHMHRHTLDIKKIHHAIEANARKDGEK